MNKRLLTRIAVVAVVAILGYFQKDKFDGTDSPASSPSIQAPAASTQPSASPQPKSPAPRVGENLVMKNLQIRDVDGSIAYRGDIDLAPTLARIKAGKKDSHTNDGSVFGNRERRLPIKERGYYREYVVRTPGIRHAGPQRLIIGGNGEVYYTHDHYQTFKKVQL
ncbi:MAG: ribonuclease domain-containing protein [Verrucomicrobiales bacterium]|nr:ribonuclease domain-containing protein [Verrucomicrobiales bacterium]